MGEPLHSSANHAGLRPIIPVGTEMDAITQAAMAAASATSAPDLFESVKVQLADLLAGNKLASGNKTGRESAIQNIPDTQSFNVLTYNMFMIPCQDRMETKRAKGFVDSIPDNYDVLVFSEAFIKETRDTLQGLAGKGYRFHTEVLNDQGFEKCLLGVLPLGPINGGVVIYSKWPIVRAAQMTYNQDQTSGTDQFSKKGAVYVAINKNGVRYHVFGTHTQSDSDTPGDILNFFNFDRMSEADTRNAQFGQLRNFIRQFQISSSEPVIIAGDMNVDKLGHLAEFRNMQDVLEVDPSPPNLKPTIDPHNFWATETTPLYLDYILTSARHKRPQVASLETYAFKTVDGVDLSDHYAVGAHFLFDVKTERSSFLASGK